MENKEEVIITEETVEEPKEELYLEIVDGRVYKRMRTDSGILLYRRVEMTDEYKAWFEEQDKMKKDFEEIFK